MKKHLQALTSSFSCFRINFYFHTYKSTSYIFSMYFYLLIAQKGVLCPSWSDCSVVLTLSTTTTAAALGTLWVCVRRRRRHRAMGRLLSLSLLRLWLCVCGCSPQEHSRRLQTQHECMYVFICMYLCRSPPALCVCWAAQGPSRSKRERERESASESNIFFCWPVHLTTEQPRRRRPGAAVCTFRRCKAFSAEPFLRWWNGGATCPSEICYSPRIGKYSFDSKIILRKNLIKAIAQNSIF